MLQSLHNKKTVVFWSSTFLDLAWIMLISSNWCKKFIIFTEIKKNNIYNNSWLSYTLKMIDCMYIVDSSGFMVDSKDDGSIQK